VLARSESLLAPVSAALLAGALLAGAPFAVALLAASGCGDDAAPATPPAPSVSANASATASASTGTSASPASSSASAVDETASLSFVRNGKPVRDIALGALLREVPAETFTAYDPYYNREKTFRAVPLAEVVRKGFAGADVALPDQEYVLRARDGYTVPMRGSRVFEAGAYIAFADADFPGWEPVGQQRANPGPFYVVWRNKDQQDTETHPRPWQLAAIEIARFEDLFPHTFPKGEADGSPAMRGFAIFKEQCVHCHAVNREGGRVGPDLNVPKSIVEYRPVDQIKAYVRDPLAFRYGNMPAHPFLKDGDLDDLVGYFSAMKTRKHDPAKKEPAKDDAKEPAKGSANKEPAKR
jgi:mono/diheme cytochrome c family protein